MVSKLSHIDFNAIHKKASTAKYYINSTIARKLTRKFCAHPKTASQILYGTADPRRVIKICNR